MNDHDWPDETGDLDWSDDLPDDNLPEGHKSGFVALVGRPNVGKSTLMNAFMRQKLAIVTPRPQTTRTRQLAILTTDDYQIIFVDTPGIMQPRHKLDEYMVGTAVEALDDADVVVWMVDAAEPPGAGDRAIAERLSTLPQERLILALNKADLLQADEILPRSDAYRALLPDADWLLFSASEGHGVPALLDLIVDHLPEGPRYYPPDQVTETFTRDIVAELIREQILLQLRDEIPYGVAVKVDEYKERENGVVYIGATVYVERENHKAIVIGQKGRRLRQLGAAARKEIEAFLDTRIFLELWVKEAPKWRHDENALRRFGYAA